MAGTQDLRRRIKSITGTKKVTRAMQLVSASKMRKSIQLLENSKHYTEELLKLESKTPEATHPLLVRYPKANKILILVLSTNKGLVGGFNSNIFKALNAFELENKDEIVYITMGKKVREGLLRKNIKLLADFEKLETASDMEFISGVAELLATEYSKGIYKEVYIAYNQFVSSLTQKAGLIKALPINGVSHSELGQYRFEPDTSTVIDHLARRMIGSRVLSAMLESDASEHSARMIMMKNATDSAGDLLFDLTLTLNQLRQNKITTELSEITAGKLALENN